MKKLTLAFAALSLLACGPTAPSGPQLYPLAVDPNPLTVTPTLDAAKAVTVDVPRSGGTVTTTAADGTVYTLTLPEAALLEDVTVTMTPVTALAGLPFGDGVYGVQLEPEGQRFAGAVTLTITPPMDVPVNQQLPIGWSGAGNVVSLATVNPEKAAFELTLAHFSGYALLLAKKGMSATIEGARHRLGGTEEDRFTSAVAEAAQKAREKIFSGGEEAGLDFTTLLAEYEAKVLQQRKDAAGDSCANARLYLSSEWAYERQRALLGLMSSSFWNPSEALEFVARACMKEEFELCRDNHIITRILPAYLQLDRQCQLLGMYDPTEQTSFPPIFLLDVQEYLGKCLAFDLDLTSSVTFVKGQGGEEHTTKETVHARSPSKFTLPADGKYAPNLPLPVVAAGALISGGPAPLTSSDYMVTYERCSTVNSATPKAGQLRVGFLLFSRQAGGPAQRALVQDFTVSPVLTPNLSEYDVTLRTYDATGNPTCHTPMPATLVESWSTTAAQRLFDRFPFPELGVGITGWTVANGNATLATKDVSFTDGDAMGAGMAVVNAHLEVIHTPAAQ
ncbi:MAG: hypothetical protein AB1730_11380 [Myxococcota bacterium]